jgi:hypothetical protein
LSRKYCFLATEGPHDQAAIGRLLQLARLEKFNGMIKDLDPFWEKFVPKPLNRDERLYARINVPSVLTSPTHSVAIYWGEGSKLKQNINDLLTLEYRRYVEKIHAFGLVVDSDKQQPNLVAKNYAKALQNFFPMLSETPGVITTSSPRTGIYVLPDNKRSGVLDSVLVDCASVVYPDHRNGALQFLNDLDSMHTKHLNAGARNKAVVGCIANIIEPGRSNTSSIAQDKWISEQTLNNSDLALLQQFLKDLLELP